MIRTANMKLKGSRTDRPAVDAFHTRSCRPIIETRAVALMRTSQLLVN